jgi:hypothetical protein
MESSLLLLACTQVLSTIVLVFGLSFVALVRTMLSRLSFAQLACDDPAYLETKAISFTVRTYSSAYL